MQDNETPDTIESLRGDYWEQAANECREAMKDLYQEIKDYRDSGNTGAKDLIAPMETARAVLAKYDPELPF